jgi:hypothetical protein
MAKTIDYQGQSPETLWIVEVDNTFRTYVYEGQAVLRLHRLLQLNKKPKLIKYKGTNNEDE